MKKILILIFSITFFSTVSNAVTYNSDPKIFISELVEDALKVLSDKSTSKTDKAKEIEKIALANVDITALGMYTLGEIRKTLSEKNLDKYEILFEKYFIKYLTSSLSDYSSNKLEILGAEQKSSNYTIVQSKIIESENQPEVQINWRVYTKDPLKPLIRDLIIEGLSLARTQKEEFASILNTNNNDINALFLELDKFIAK
jgi:phospholipid transport system substrate-binding protein